MTLIDALSRAPRVNGSQTHAALAVAALVVSIVALLIAGGSFVHTVIATRRAERDRQNELDLQRRQFEVQLEDRENQKRARISGRSVSRSPTEHFDEHQILIHNSGPAAARNIKIGVHRE